MYPATQARCFFLEFHIGIQKMSCVLLKAGAMPIGFKDVEKYIKIDPTFSKGYSRKIAVQFFMKEYVQYINKQTVETLLPRSLKKDWLNSNLLYRLTCDSDLPEISYGGP
ncbi:hypothetical protein Bca4012_010923 [Brassica carinata]